MCIQALQAFFDDFIKKHGLYIRWVTDAVVNITQKAPDRALAIGFANKAGTNKIIPEFTKIIIHLYDSHVIVSCYCDITKSPWVVEYADPQLFDKIVECFREFLGETFALVSDELCEYSG